MARKRSGPGRPPHHATTKVRHLAAPSMADHLIANMRVGGSHAGPEIMLLTIVSGARFVEVPVNYLPRVGVSSVTGDPKKAFALGLRMILLILRFRLKSPRRLPRPGAFGAAEAPAPDESPG